MYGCLTSRTLTCTKLQITCTFWNVSSEGPRILLITFPIPIGLIQGFLSKGISLHAKKASSDTSFPQYLFKHNFFAMSAPALQRSQLLSPNGDEVRMRLLPFASKLNGPATPLISRVVLHIRAPFISSYVHSLYNSSGPCIERSSYFGAPTGCFSLR